MIKLLEVPTMLLEQRIKKEIEENPVLEEVHDAEEPENDTEASLVNDDSDTETDKNDDEFTLEDYLNDEDIPNYRLVASNVSKDDKREEIPFSVGVTFQESLKSQLGLTSLNDREKQLALYLIGNIDDGYLRRKLSAIADDVAFALGLDTNEDELEKILYVIQEFDPPGVGARDLQECLLLQLRVKENGSTTASTAPLHLLHIKF